MTRRLKSTTWLLSMGAMLIATGAALADAGFSVSIDGETVAGDTAVARQIRRAEATVTAANLDLRYSGLTPAPRLGFEIEPLGADRLKVTSRLNYPAFVSRSELRVQQTDGAGRVLSTTVYPVPPNGEARIALPEGRGLLLSHRVYDAAGRFDETQTFTLLEAGRQAALDSPMQRRGIPLAGGEVTVTGDGLRPGATVIALGETITADDTGRLSVLRILPPGRHDLSVGIAGGPRLDRVVTVPRAETFGIGVIDVTAGWREMGDAPREAYVDGRISGYGTARMAGGLEITGAIDTGERDIERLFSLADDTTPEGRLRRLDPGAFYPTYGDDSLAIEDAPTDGPLYLRVEKDGNFAMWGTGRAPLGGSHYLRNERVLYGAHAAWQSAQTTGDGAPRARVQAYASSPDRLPGRDVFRGTGGSFYLLSRQDISVGTEVVTVAIRDGVTGRLLGSETLVAGRDYQINSLQGSIVLTRPLSGFVAEGPVSGDPGSEPYADLEVSYEYTPVATDLDGMALGARAETWVSDRLRFGVTGQVERTAGADQTARGVDLLYRLSDETEVALEFAQSEGPGFAASFSADAGLTRTTLPAGGGSGEAQRIDARAALSDLGLAADGAVSAYFERRTEGFTTLDHVVTETTGDERLFGFGLDLPVADDATLRLGIDAYENAAGAHEHVGTLAWDMSAGPGRRLTFAVEHTDRDRDGEDGFRTDVALRFATEVTPDASWYAFAQATVAQEGLGDNHRVGLGGRVSGDDWALSGEVSAGSTGPGARVLAERQTAGGGTAWAGYDLTPGRDVAGVTLDGRDHGRIVFGGRQPVADGLTVYGETSYDAFGRHRSALSRYGVEIDRGARLNYDLAVEVGRVKDPVGGDIRRRGLSFGMRFADGEDTRAGARLEFRRDARDGEGDTRTVLVSLDGQHRLDAARRLLFSARHAQSDADGDTAAEGRLTDVNLGFALRPVETDRFNLLARYRYLFDDYGQRVDGLDVAGPRQESHIVSVDGEYELGPRWSLGAKIGARLSRTAAGETAAFAANDAALAVINGRYHVTGKWDALIEYRMFEAFDAGFSEEGALAAIYRHVGDHVKVGLGYNFTTFSDDLSDLVRDDKGLFLNVLAKF